MKITKSLLKSIIKEELEEAYYVPDNQGDVEKVGRAGEPNPRRFEDDDSGPNTQNEFAEMQARLRRIEQMLQKMKSDKL